MSGLKLWIISICMVSLLAFCWYFSETLMMFLISGTLAFLLSPPVNFLQKKMKTKKRLLPTAIVFLASLAIVITTIALLVPVLYEQIVSVIKNIGSYAATFTDFLDGLAEKAVEFGLPESLLNSVDKLTTTLESFIVSLVTSIGGTILEKTLGVLDIIIFLCLTFYFMLDGPNIFRTFVGLFPQNGSIRIQRISLELKLLVWNYLKQHFVISSCMSIILMIGFFCFGLEYGVLLAILAFFLDFIPYFGSIFSGVVAGAVALITGGFGYAVWVVLFVLIVQQVEGNILMPMFQGKTASVHPLAIIFSLLACSQIWGVFGMFISVPVAGLVKVLLIEIRDLYRSIDRPGGFGSEDPENPVLSPLIEAAEHKKQHPKLWVKLTNLLKHKKK
ncbi:MAG: AI-2E family transporter [Clostridia bacterium]|nr:AI-2E family transporter [Clostridia bacterium]